MIIDETLVGFGSKCLFRKYVPSKPAKYGIKTNALCDAKALYVWNTKIYAGTQPERPFKADKQYNSSQNVMTRFISDIYGPAQNITFDN